MKEDFTVSAIGILFCTKLFDCVKPIIERLLKPASELVVEQLQQKLNKAILSKFEEHDIEDPSEQRLIQEGIITMMKSRIKEIKKVNDKKELLRKKNEIKQELNKHLDDFTKEYVKKNTLVPNPPEIPAIVDALIVQREYKKNSADLNSEFVISRKQSKPQQYKLSHFKIEEPSNKKDETPYDNYIKTAQVEDVIIEIDPLQIIGTTDDFGINS